MNYIVRLNKLYRLVTQLTLFDFYLPIVHKLYLYMVHKLVLGVVDIEDDDESNTKTNESKNKVQLLLIEIWIITSRKTDFLVS
jgi:hypothetical protein